MHRRDLGTGEVRKYYGNGEQRIASSGAQPVACFYTRDHLGSVRELVDSTGAIHSQTDYDPFGKVSQQHGPLPDFAFTGHYFHEPSGLHLAPFREYDASIGKWMRRDPIAEAGGINLYGYVGNGPMSYADELGLKEKAIDPTDPGRQEYASTATPAYNCHSYAWSNGTSWLNNPSAKMATATKLDPNASNKPGDIVVWWKDLNHDGVMQTNEIKHSAVVIQVDPAGNTTRCRAKEGQSTIVEHHPSDSHEQAYGKNRDYYRPSRPVVPPPPLTPIQPAPPALK